MILRDGPILFLQVWFVIGIVTAMWYFGERLRSTLRIRDLSYMVLLVFSGPITVILFFFLFLSQIKFWDIVIWKRK